MLIEKFLVFRGRPLQNSEEERFEEDAVIMLEQLVVNGFNERQAWLAERNILYGWPVKRGYIVMADFYPDADELKKIGVSIERQLLAANKEGYGLGYRAGVAAGCRQTHEDYKNNLEYCERMAALQPGVDIAHREALCSAREEAIEAEWQKITKARKALLRMGRQSQQRSTGSE